MSLTAFFFSCGGKGAEDVSSLVAKVAVDGDPYALLPSQAYGLAKLNIAKQKIDDQNSPISRWIQRWLPFSKEFGFSVNRDVESAVFAFYSLEGADFVGLVSGRFDPDKWARVIQNQTVFKNGVVVLANPYRDQVIYSVNQIGFTFLSSRRALVGTEALLRRSLDRIYDNQIGRVISSWLLSNVEFKGDELSLAADVTNMPLNKISVGVFTFDGLRGLEHLTATVNHDGQVIKVLSDLTYADVSQAVHGVSELKQGLKMVGFARYFVKFLPEFRDVDIKQNQKQASLSFFLDEKNIDSVLERAGYLTKEP